MNVPQHTITLKPLETARDKYDYFRAICVDGLIWGHVSRRQAGVHGSFYYFHEGKNGRISIERKSPLGRTLHNDVEVPGDKAARRRASYEEQKAGLPNLETRLLTKIRELIAEGRFRHPDVVKKAEEEASLAYRKANEELEAEQEANFKARAEIATGMVREILTSDQHTALVEAVLNAMKWAAAQ